MEKLSDLKKELSELSKPDLIKLCLRVAKLKRENKALKNLLYDMSLLHSTNKITKIPKIVFEWLGQSIRHSFGFIALYFSIRGSKLKNFLKFWIKTHF
jgi:hypothetical protein